jgi:hypothetical protein
VPPVLACAADVAMTLRGQPAAYWGGGFGVTDEFNPAARLLLQFHPAAFVAAAVVSSLILVALAVVLSRTLAVALTFLVTFAHAVAAAAWLVRGGFTPAGVAGAVVMLLVTERLVDCSWRGDARDAGRAQSDRATG